MGLKILSLFCPTTAPIVVSLASNIISNGWLQLGEITIGALDNCSLSISNALLHSSEIQTSHLSLAG